MVALEGACSQLPPVAPPTGGGTVGDFEDVSGSYVTYVDNSSLSNDKGGGVATFTIVIETVGDEYVLERHTPTARAIRFTLSDLGAARLPPYLHVWRSNLSDPGSEWAELQQTMLVPIGAIAVDPHEGVFELLLEGGCVYVHPLPFITLYVP